MERVSIPEVASAGMPSIKGELTSDFCDEKIGRTARQDAQGSGLNAAQKCYYARVVAPLGELIDKCFGGFQDPLLRLLPKTIGDEVLDEGGESYQPRPITQPDERGFAKAPTRYCTSLYEPFSKVHGKSPSHQRAIHVDHTELVCFGRLRPHRPNDAQLSAHLCGEGIDADILCDFWGSAHDEMFDLPQRTNCAK